MNREGLIGTTMQKISGVANFRRNALGYSQLHYLKEGKKYLDRAYQQQTQNLLEARRLFSKAQTFFNQIPPAKKIQKLTEI